MSFESKVFNLSNKEDKNGKDGGGIEKTIDREFEDFYSKHRLFFENYAGDSSISIKSHKELPQSQQGTFAIDLKNGNLYVAMDVFRKAGYGDEASFFAFLHEYEHFREIRELMKYHDGKTDGKTIWKKHYNKISRSKGLAILDNCIDDIKMNRTVLERAPTLIDTKNELYENFNFPDDDLRKQPLHLQFAFALLRRKMLPDRETIVDPRVQSVIEKIESMEFKNGEKMFDVMTSPETNMALRLKLQEAFIEPEFLKLMQKAKEEQEEKQQQQQQGNSKEKEQEGSGDRQKKAEQENLDKKDEKSENHESGDSQEGDSQEGDSQEGDSQAGKSDSQNSIEKPKSEDDFFGDAYEEYERKNPQATPIESIEEAVKEYSDYEKSHTQDSISLEERQLKALAEREGVSTQDLKNYQRFWSQIENLTNPKTNEKVVDELRDIFQKIITKRQPPQQHLRTNLDEGSELDDYVSVVSGGITGKFPEKIWQDFERVEKPARMVGNFDVTLVCDRSGSMEGEKARQQRIAVGLFLEMLREFSIDLENVHLSPERDLNVQTEVWGFGGESEVGIIKPLGKELSTKDRVYAYKTLGSTPGWETLDYRPLQEISNSITQDTIEKIQNGEYRKIVIVITDGISSNPADLQRAQESLIEKGVIVVVIGLGNDADDIVKNYKKGILCPSPHSLGAVTADLLAETLEQL